MVTLCLLVIYFFPLSVSLWHTHRKNNYSVPDPLSNIIEALSKKRSKAKVKEKLMALGLVTDSKELHKKRARGGNSKRKQRGSSENSDDEREDGSGEKHWV